MNAAVAADKLDAHVQRIAACLASRSPTGAQTIKRLVYRGLEMTLADGLVQEGLALRDILASADYAEGLAAFAEKRQPRFTRRHGDDEPRTDSTAAKPSTSRSNCSSASSRRS